MHGLKRSSYRHYQGHHPACFFGSLDAFWDTGADTPASRNCLRKVVTSASSTSTRTRASSRNLSWARCCCHVRKPCRVQEGSYRTCVGKREEGAYNIDCRTEQRDGYHARGIICVETSMGRGRLGARWWLSA